MRRIIFPLLSLGLIAACGDQGSHDADTAPAVEAELGQWGINLANMDTSVAPGDDFYNYINGTWQTSYELKPDETSFGGFRVLRDRSETRVRALVEELAANASEKGSLEQLVGDYFATYMDLETRNAKGIDPIRPLLAEVDAIANIADLTRAFGRSGHLGANTPIGAFVTVDRQNPDRYIVGLSQTGLGLPDRSFYLEDNPRFEAIRAAYRTNIVQMLGFADIDGADTKADAIIALETKLAEVHWPRTELRNRDKTLNPLPGADLAGRFPDYDIVAHFAAGGITELPDTVNINTPTSLDATLPIIDETDLATWKAYLSYHIISNHAGFLSEEIDAANFAFRKVLTGQQEQRALWKRAVNVVGGGGALGEGLGKLYVERHFPPEAKAEMERLVENLRVALRQNIDGLEWMSDATKVEAYKKLESFRPKIGYPDKWEDYAGLDIVGDDLITNVLAVRNFRIKERNERLGKPTDKDEWRLPPQTVNAFYNSVFNEITFPAGILQAPFFDLGADPAVNYGAIGAVIGHEMGHGFDDQGSKSDYAGIQRNWWTDQDREAFDALGDALVAQYNQYCPLENECVNGRLTLGENIGDLGGLSMAYTAYKLSLNGEEAPVIDGYTGDQRFFMAWGQVWQSKRRQALALQLLKSDSHSPPYYRVNGVVRNLDAWYEAFGVTQDNALYLPPEERVTIW